MKHALLWLAVALMTALLIGLTPTSSPGIDEPSSTDPARIIRDAADLVLLAVSRSCDVKQRVQGITGNTTVTGYMRATVWIGTDLNQARVISMNTNDRVLVIELERPGVMQVSLDPQASRLTAERNGLWVLALDSAHETDLTREVFAQAELQIRQHPLEPQLARRAELHAHTVLQQLFDTGGWTVELRWRGP